jgi:cytochrome P450
MCIGASFATMEIKIVLAMLLQRFRMELPDGTRVDPRIAITMAPRGGLRMKVRDRRSARAATGRVRGRIRALVDLSN